MDNRFGSPVQFFVPVVLSLIIGIFMFTTSDLRARSHSLEELSRNPPPGEESSYIQNKQGLWLYHHSWVPETQKGIVFLVHGFGEHSDRHGYKHLAQVLNDNGYAVFAMDHQGFGRSHGDRAFVEKFSDYVDDYSLFVKTKLAIEDPDDELPHFLLGHSMGGLVSLLLAARNPSIWKGVIVTGPAVENPRDSFLFRTVLSVLDFFVPQYSLFSLDPTQSSRNATAVELFLADPLTTRTGMRVHALKQFVSGWDELALRAPQIKFPYLILHGEDDKTCLLESSKNLHAKTKSFDKTLKSFPGMRHGLFEDPEREALVFPAIVDWLKHNTTQHNSK